MRFSVQIPGQHSRTIWLQWSGQVVTDSQSRGYSWTEALAEWASPSNWSSNSSALRHAKCGRNPEQVGVQTLACLFFELHNTAAVRETLVSYHVCITVVICTTNCFQQLFGKSFRAFQHSNPQIGHTFFRLPWVAKRHAFAPCLGTTDPWGGGQESSWALHQGHLAEARPIFLAKLALSKLIRLIVWWFCSRN